MSGSKERYEDFRETEEGLRNLGSVPPNITLDKFNWTNSRFLDFKGDLTPKLSLIEFQPDIVFNTGALKVEGIGSLAQIGFGKFFTGLTQGTAQGVTGAVKSGAALGARVTTSNAANKTLRSNGIQLDVSREIYNNLIKGGIVGSYEIPYVGDTFVEYEEEGWSQSGLQEVFGDKLNQHISNHTPYTTFGVPQWSMAEGGGRLPVVEVTFNLYNNSLANLCSNYTMVHHLSSGAMWLHDGLIKQAPNLYHVACDGRFIMPYSSMTIKVEHGGMRRKLHPFASSHESFKGVCTTMLPFTNENTFFPDYYKITVKLQSLLPNNYNSFIMYGNGKNEPLLKEFGAKSQANETVDNIAKFANALGVTADVISDAKAKLTNIAEKASKGFLGFLN
jgi:hypothetical protein